MVSYIPKNTIGFPDPRYGEKSGFFAVGGDLNEEMIKIAYAHGIFPWTPFRKEDNNFIEEDGTPMNHWFCPMERFVIYTDELHISHSLRQLINSRKYRSTLNRNFEDVIYNCGHVNDRINEEGAWLGPKVMEVYTNLHKEGVMQSIEIWNNEGMLVGGLYGSRTRDCFIGESMFSLEPNTSKLALVALSTWLQTTRRYPESESFIDCQMPTPHLKSMGGVTIPYMQYLQSVCPDAHDFFLNMDKENASENDEENQVSSEAEI